MYGHRSAFVADNMPEETFVAEQWRSAWLVDGPKVIAEAYDLHAMCPSKSERTVEADQPRSAVTAGFSKIHDFDVAPWGEGDLQQNMDNEALWGSSKVGPTRDVGTKYSLDQRQLIEFFQCKGTDDEDRTLEQIIKWDDQLWNCCHNHIQWVLPTDEPSRFNPDAPILDETLQAIFKEDRSLQNNLRRGLQRFMSFLGLSLEGDFDLGERLQVVKASNFNRRTLTCWTGPDNHNWSRLSRALRCLGLVGMVREQRALYACLYKLVDEHPDMIESSTVNIWKERAGPIADGKDEDALEDLDLKSPETAMQGKTRRFGMGKHGQIGTMSSSVPGGSLKSLRRYFASVDTDRDGDVSQEELPVHIKSLVEQRTGTFSQELSELFEVGPLRDAAKGCPLCACCAAPERAAQNSASKGHQALTRPSRNTMSTSRWQQALDGRWHPQPTWPRMAS